MTLEKSLACPICKNSLKFADDGLHCKKCKKQYLIKEGIPILLREKGKDHGVWEKHWKKLKKESLFGKFCELHRRFIISNSVAYYFNKYFSKKGVFVECGSGTSQTLAKVKKGNKKLISIDIAITPLKEARKTIIDHVVCSDILDLPFKDNSIDGIWNLGVMEHFENDSIDRILNEFHRVLKKGGRIILFWVPSFGSSQIVLTPIETIISILKKKKFTFFPDEITKIRSLNHAKNVIKKSKFKLINTHFNYKDLFTYVVIIAEK